MPQKTVIKTAEFDCDKCEQRVVFRYAEIQFFADELNEPIHTSVDKIIDYGRCGVSQHALVPNHPLHTDMEACPFYRDLKS